MFFAIIAPQNIAKSGKYQKFLIKSRKIYGYMSNFASATCGCTKQNRRLPGGQASGPGRRYRRTWQAPASRRETARIRADRGQRADPTLTARAAQQASRNAGGGRPAGEKSGASYTGRAGGKPPAFNRNTSERRPAETRENLSGAPCGAHAARDPDGMQAAGRPQK